MVLTLKAAQNLSSLRVLLNVLNVVNENRYLREERVIIGETVRLL